jgi:hypothetical protein
MYITVVKKDDSYLVGHGGRKAKKHPNPTLLRTPPSHLRTMRYISFVYQSTARETPAEVHILSNGVGQPAMEQESNMEHIKEFTTRPLFTL